MLEKNIQSNMEEIIECKLGKVKEIQVNDTHVQITYGGLDEWKYDPIFFHVKFYCKCESHDIKDRGAFSQHTDNIGLGGYKIPIVKVEKKKLLIKPPIKYT